MQNLTSVGQGDFPAYPLSIRTDFIGKKPEYGKRSASGWRRAKLNAVDLAMHVSSGYAIAVAQYKGNFRTQANAEQCYVLGLDFDKGLLSSEQAAAHPLLSRISAVILPTASDSPEFAKIRTVSFLDRSVGMNELTKLKAILIGLVGDLGLDHVVFETARYFYGSQPDPSRVFVAPHNVLHVDKFLAEYKEVADTATITSGRRKGGGRGVSFTGDRDAEADALIRAAGESLLDFEPESLGSVVLDQLQYVSRLWLDGREPSYELWCGVWMGAYRASDGADEVLQYILDCEPFWAKYSKLDVSTAKVETVRAWAQLHKRDEREITGATLAWLARKVGWGRHNPYGRLTHADIKLDVVELADGLDTLLAAVKPGTNLAIKSQTGSGKTKANIALIKHLNVEANRAVIISPFINLCHSAASGMRAGGVDAISYDERGANQREERTSMRRKGEAVAVKRDPIVVRTPQNVLGKHMLVENLDYVFIEEIHALLHHLTKPKGEGGHMRDSERVGFREWLVKALQSPTCTVVMVDAGLTDVSVDYLKAIAPITVVHNTGTRRKADVTRVSEDEALSKAINKLKAGERVVVNAPSKLGCERLYEVLAPYATSSVMITADTKGEAATKDFRADVEAGAASTQLVIYNAAMGTGVSIEKTCPALIIQYADYLNGSAWIQHLNRYRQQSEVLLVLTLRPPRQARKTYGDLKGDALAKWRAELKAEGLKQRDVGDKRSEAQAYDRLSVGLEAARRAELVDADLAYAGILETDGREYINAVDLDSKHPNMKRARELITTKHAAILKNWRTVAPIDTSREIVGDYTAEQLALGTLHYRLKRLSKGYLPANVAPEVIAEMLLNHETTIRDLEGTMREDVASTKGIGVILNQTRGVTEVEKQASKRTLVQVSRTMITGLFDVITPEKLAQDGKMYVHQIRRDRKAYDAVIATRANNKYAAVEARCEGNYEDMAVMFLKYVLESVGLKLGKRRYRPRNEAGKQIDVYTHYITNAQEACDVMLWRERGRKNDENIEHIKSTFGATEHDAEFRLILAQVFRSAEARARLQDYLARGGVDEFEGLRYALAEYTDPI